jgi:DNA-binding transcriptional LysR family regulator
MKLNGLDLNKIHVFFSVVKHGGYRGASEELQLTRSALSQSVSGLETALGVDLFQRVGRRLVPTNAAMRFYREVSLYQGRLQESVSQLVGETGKAEGVLKIGAYLEFTKSKMMPVIEEFLTRNPRAQIKFVFDAPSRLESLLSSQKVDLAISVFPQKSGKNSSSRKLYQEELVLIGSADLISERPKPAVFQTVPIIDYFPNHRTFNRWSELHFKKKVFRGSVRCFAASADMVLGLAERGLGVGVVPRYVFETADPARNLHVVQPTDRRLYDYIWLNERSGERKSAIYRSFCSVLESRFLQG